MNDLSKVILLIAYSKKQLYHVDISSYIENMSWRDLHSCLNFLLDNSFLCLSYEGCNTKSYHITARGVSYVQSLSSDIIFDLFFIKYCDNILSNSFGLTIVINFIKSMQLSEAQLVFLVTFNYPTSYERLIIFNVVKRISIEGQISYD